MLDLGGDNVVLFFFVELCYAFESHVVTFCGATCEDDFFGIRANQGGDLLKVRKRYFSCLLSSDFSLPAEGVGGGVRVAISICHVGQHAIQYAWIERRCGLVVHIEWFACT